MTIEEFAEHEPDCAVDYDQEDYLSALSQAYEDIDNTMSVLWGALSKKPSRNIERAYEYLSKAMERIEREM